MERWAGLSRVICFHFANNVRLAKVSKAKRSRVDSVGLVGHGGRWDWLCYHRRFDACGREDVDVVVDNDVDRHAQPAV